MLIPRFINIGFITYKVVFTSLADCYGLCDKEKCTIYIEKNMPKDKQFKIFIHECLHAIMYEYGIDFPVSGEENLVEMLTTGVTEVIQQIMEANNADI